MTIRGSGLSLEAAQSVSKDSRSRAVPNPERLKRVLVVLVQRRQMTMDCFEGDRQEMCLSLETSPTSVHSQ